ncbi:hemolysin D [Rubricella aquisinus]|uniref:Membrane fusion protein (MFP) family protein n=1 Tax=Rubricella aquisinus TaxID=2028108 RepID=A0A840X2P9_9RHOB|nr:HlyD family type I secretion periplasmic adaptor subunit [Rubricella aquisinus]MBB5517114.1 hemolysin D [Rubricella aquisinus]
MSKFSITIPSKDARPVTPRRPPASPKPPETPAPNPQAIAVMQADDAPIIARQSARDSYEFMPALLEVMERPASPTGRLLVYIICTLFALAVAWATFGRVDIVAMAPGTIQPEGGAVIVQASKSGTIAQVWVEEGDRVQEGDILLTLDDREATAPRGQIEERLLRQTMTARVNARLLEMLEAPVENRLADLPLPPELEALAETQAQARLATFLAEQDRQLAEISELETRLAVARANVAERQDALPLYREHEANIASLATRGLVRQAEWLEVQLALAQQEETLLREEGEITMIGAQLATLRANRAARIQAARYAAVEALLEAEQTGSIALIERARLDTVDERLTVRAPRDGVMARVDVDEGGTIVQPGLVIMTILPEDDLVVEARLPSRDIGFVALGMEVAVKVDAYPYTRFGHLDGTVTTISADSTIAEGEREPAYTITVTLAADALEVEGNRYPISTGMQVTADIRTGERSILDYFLSPIRASVQETLRER